jgi:hypothetical protein
MRSSWSLFSTLFVLTLLCRYGGVGLYRRSCDFVFRKSFDCLRSRENGPICKGKHEREQLCSVYEIDLGSP